MDYKKLLWISVGVLIAFWIGPVVGTVVTVVAGFYYGSKLVTGLLSEGLGFIFRKLGVGNQNIGKIQKQRMEKKNAKTPFL